MKEHIRIKLIKRIICMILFFAMTGMVTVNAAEGQQEEISGELEIVSNISEDIMQKYLTDFCKKYRVFDTFSSTLMSLSQYWLYFFVKFKIISSSLCIVVL